MADAKKIIDGVLGSNGGLSTLDNLLSHAESKGVDDRTVRALLRANNAVAIKTNEQDWWVSWPSNAACLRAHVNWLNGQDNSTRNKRN